MTDNGNGPRLVRLGARPSISHSQYEAYLARAITESSPALLQVDTWDRDLLLDCLGKSLPAPAKMKRGSEPPPPPAFPPLQFTGPKLLRNEMKAYVLATLLDPRHDHYQAWVRRRRVVAFVAAMSDELLQRFNVTCLADIPSQLLPATAEGFVSGHYRHNDELVALFEAWCRLHTERELRQTVAYTVQGSIKRKSYAAGEVALIGDVHRWLIVNREQMPPLEQRNMIVLSDVFSEDVTRLNERQKRRESIINFYKMPPWMRAATRAFILDRISQGACAPGTANGLLSHLMYFRDFMAERFDAPSPRVLTTQLIEDDMVAWGLARNIRGYNWLTDTLAFLDDAPRYFPREWRPLNIDKRIVRKLGRDRTTRTRANLFERADAVRDRSMPPRIVEAIATEVHRLPAPCPLLFLMAMTTGARAEDLHAVLFDAIQPDPHDDRFVVLHFWQNKVSRWNTKPLLKTDPMHKQVLEAVEAQRMAIIERYEKPTKYLFPSFNGSLEGFLDHKQTANLFRQLCIEIDLRADDGEMYRFRWHALRHYRGTQMAHQGQDILAIMLELGHVSPDMAMTYVNRRLDLKKRSLLAKGAGDFYTIRGRIDHHVEELLLKKNALVATRVAGGACMLPQQLGDWCDHAHACLSCKHFRADSRCADHFESERTALKVLVEEQDAALATVDKSAKPRTAAVAQQRVDRNQKALVSVENILRAIRANQDYSGTENRFRRPSS
jgi:integrase